MFRVRFARTNLRHNCNKHTEKLIVRSAAGFSESILMESDFQRSIG